MFDKPFDLEIVTPERIMFKARATSVSAPGVEGNFQVLFRHAPLLTTLDVGKIKLLTAEGKELLFATSGGFVEVRHNLVVVLVETAERAEEIDVERAKASRERAERRLKERDEKTDAARAEASLRRAMNRLRVAGQA
jgi:F-type H+-transporting ATPase subunit epsilon